MTVQDIIYPHNTIAISSRQVRRIKKNINICRGLLVDPILNSPNKLTSWEMYGTQLLKCPHKKKSPLQKKTSLSSFITYTSQSMYNPSDSQTHSSSMCSLSTRITCQSYSVSVPIRQQEELLNKWDLGSQRIKTDAFKCHKCILVWIIVRAQHLTPSRRVNEGLSLQEF